MNRSFSENKLDCVQLCSTTFGKTKFVQFVDWTLNDFINLFTISDYQSAGQEKLEKSKKCYSEYAQLGGILHASFAFCENFFHY